MPNEYISREAVLKDLCEIMNYDGIRIAKGVPILLVSRDQVQHVIRKVPAADVVPVVRCGECIHRVNMEHSMDNKEICCGRMAMRVVALDDYCSHGVRIDGGDAK